MRRKQSQTRENSLIFFVIDRRVRRKFEPYETSEKLFPSFFSKEEQINANESISPVAFSNKITKSRRGKWKVATYEIKRTLEVKVNNVSLLIIRFLGTYDSKDTENDG